MRFPSKKERAEYAARRMRFMHSLGPSDIAVLAGAHEKIRNRDVHYRFRQHSDVLYLAGVAEPDAVLVIAPGRPEGEFVLFVQPRVLEREIWVGKRIGPEGAVRHYGADQAFDVSELDIQLPALLAGRERVHCTFGESTVFDQQLISAVRAVRDGGRRSAGWPKEFVALERSLHEQRLIKSPAEQILLRHACSVSCDAHVRAMRFARPGRFEYQVAAELEYVFARSGMEPGYASIVASGENGCTLHYVDNDKRLKDKELILVDAGGEWHGYTADITRTFPVNGRYDGVQKSLYEMVLRAQLAAINELKPGRDVSAPHLAAVRVLTEGMMDVGLLRGDLQGLIESHEYRRFYMHGTGHWLGLDVHDVGLYKKSGVSRTFEPGMVMTVEPGIYVAPGVDDVDPRFHGVGIRIEDDVLITEAGNEVLTSGAPKSIADIEALLREARSSRTQSI